MLVEKDDKIILTQSPLGNFIYILLCLIFTIILLVIFIFDKNLPLYEMFIFMSCLLLSGFGTIFLIFRTIVNKNLIVVDKKGITDNSSAIALGFISWDDIVDIQLKTLTFEESTQKFISITLADEEKYINKVSALKKPMLIANVKLGYGIANISLNSSGVSIEEFYEKLIEYKNNL